MDQNMFAMLGLVSNDDSTPNYTSYTARTSNVRVRRWPILGKVQYVQDKMGIAAMSFTILSWLYCTWSSTFIILLPAYKEKYVSIVFILLYLSSSFMTILLLFKTSTLSSGQIRCADMQYERTSMLDAEGWSRCRVCNVTRPPKAHHCSRCNRCVPRMDHHCQWLNNCVGEENHYSFMLLLVYACTFSLLSFTLSMLYFYGYPQCQLCDKESLYINHGVWFIYLETIISFCFSTALIMLFLNQHFNLLLGRTYIDSLIEPRPDPSTMHLRSFHDSYTQLCGTSSMIAWFNPCRQRNKPLAHLSSLV